MSSSRLRPLEERDADAVAALFVDTYGPARLIDADEIRSWLANAEFEPGWQRVLEDGGRVVGYGDIWPKSDVVELDAAAPGRWEVFLDWAEAEAHARGLPAVRMQVPHGHALAQVVAARGYVQWRSSLTMEISLTQRPNVRFPDGFEVRSYRAGDDGAVRAAVNEAFADDPLHEDVTPANFREFFLNARGFDAELWTLAFDGGDLAGCSLAFPFRGTDDALGWVGTLGVRPGWRRRGLGEALLRDSFARLYDRGLRRVGLGVDANNVTGARRLYERVGMRQVRRSENWKKAL
jgi:mycothiol synthase